MTKIIYIIIWFLIYNTQTYAEDLWVLWWSGITLQKLRTWDIHTDDIPAMMMWAINFLMWIAGTVSIIFIIIWAYKLALWSLDNDTWKWKETITLALWWLILSALSWLILKLIIDNFS